MEKRNGKIRWNAEALWLARRRMKKTQDEVAKAIKRSRETVNRVEQGRHASEEVIRDMCQLLEIPPTEVLIS